MMLVKSVRCGKMLNNHLTNNKNSVAPDILAARDQVKLYHTKQVESLINKMACTLSQLGSYINLYSFCNYYIKDRDLFNSVVLKARDTLFTRNCPKPNNEGEEQIKLKFRQLLAELEIINDDLKTTQKVQQEALTVATASLNYWDAYETYKKHSKDLEQFNLAMQHYIELHDTLHHKKTKFELVEKHEEYEDCAYLEDCELVVITH
jgi:hypothetical protein